MLMLLMNITLKITPAECFKLGTMLQPIADETKWRIQKKMIHSKVEYLVIFEFMQTFNYNRFDFKDVRKTYNFTIKLSTGLSIRNYIIEEVHLELDMIEERSILNKLNRIVLNYGVSTF